MPLLVVKGAIACALAWDSSLRMTVRGTRPRSFPWRREPTPPLDARPRIKCGAGCTGMTVEARGEGGNGGSLDFLLVRLC